jgi:hypothetical protein
MTTILSGKCGQNRKCLPREKSVGTVKSRLTNTLCKYIIVVGKGEEKNLTSSNSSEKDSRALVTSLFKQFPYSVKDWEPWLIVSRLSKAFVFN